jgi:subtilase family serine protease
MPQCYSPQQLRNAYEITPLLKSGVTGKKRTIVLIEASSIPTLQSDLHTFDQIFGLKDPHLRIIAPFGIPPFNLTAYTEAALDVQLSHSIAPDANIDVIIANYSLQAPTIESIVSALMKATKYAVDHNLGDVISLSFGVNEDCFDSAYYQYQHAILQEARAKHISIVAAAGDAGTAILSCPSPAATSGFYYAKGTTVLDDPLVTLVGGTTLHASVGKGMYQSETTWNANGGATGGGFSRVFFRPLYQSGVTGSRYRGEPDVAWVGDPTTGVPVVISLNGGIYIVPAGGTSMGAPAWAGLVALFDQYAGRRLGFLSAGLYRILQNKHSYSHAFHDIMTGNNTVRVIDLKGNITTITGYDATRGWDAVTGLGTPKAAALAPLLARLVYRNDGTNL